MKKERDLEQPEEELEELSPSQFAEKINKPYSTVMAWLKAKRIVGAKKHKVGKMEIWLIPQDAAVKLPRMGRPSAQKGVSATSSDEESDERHAEPKRQVLATKRGVKKRRKKAAGS